MSYKLIAKVLLIENWRLKLLEEVSRFRFSPFSFNNIVNINTILAF